jgi:type VI secretion system protein ImpF
MSERKDQRPGLPSVLDRLLDDDPGSHGEKPMTLERLGQALRNAVRRDLEDLLNTRQRPFPLPGGLEELEQSSFEYGIPDFTGANLTSQERRRRYLKGIEDIIRRHEPRLSAVKVVPVDQKGSSYRTLHFRIEAVLRAEPAPESVLYDSHVDVLTRSFRIQI